MQDFGTNKIIVTGACGWLGIRLIRALTGGLQDFDLLREAARELQIRCLVLPDQNVTELNGFSGRIEVLTGDIRNAADCARLCAGMAGAVLFHTAGIIHPRKVREFQEVNVTGTANLIEAAVQSKVRRAVVVSSNSPCGCNPHPDHLFDEISPYRPYLNYGRSKMRMEMVVRDRQTQGSIETVILRPPWFYGPNQPPRQTLFFQMIRDGRAPIVGSGENLRSMTYVDNLCQALLLSAMAQAANGKTYWIADARPYTINEIVGTIERLLEGEFGHRCAHKRLRLPSFTSEVAFAMDTALQSLGMYQQKIHVLSEMNKTIACCTARAQEELGYRPVIALEEGMRRSLAWCRDRGIRI